MPDKPKEEFLQELKQQADHIRSRPTLRVGARGPEFAAKEVRTSPGGADVKA